MGKINKCITFYLLLILFLLEPYFNTVYRVNPKFNYSIRGWHKEVYNWVLVPDFENAKFSKFNLKTMLEPRHIKFKSKYISVSDNKMQCPIIFISSILFQNS